MDTNLKLTMGLWGCLYPDIVWNKAKIDYWNIGVVYTLTSWETNLKLTMGPWGCLYPGLVRNKSQTDNGTLGLFIPWHCGIQISNWLWDLGVIVRNKSQIDCGTLVCQNSRSRLRDLSIWCQQKGLVAKSTLM